MALFERRALPNLITVARILAAPGVFFLIFIPTFTARMLAFLLFVVAAVSDLWDGYLARKHGWISDFGKLWDPIADKLLMVAVFVPLYMVSRTGEPSGQLVAIGSFPAWILIVVFGREVAVTVIRFFAVGRGLVIAAGQTGKYKAVFQNIFSGTAIFWLALQAVAVRRGWEGLEAWTRWSAFHGFVFLTTLAVAVVLTVFSFAVYLLEWRRQLRELV
ncbi:MAG: CDP-diacylglycerol--glycerol-3-phosphate 3-phosphatidyltransferase [Gemmatimonadota bacterium]